VVVRLIVAVNPAAGPGLAPRLADTLTGRLERAGHEVSRAEATDGDALERHLRSRVARERPDAVIAVGGDGMVHLVVNAIARSEAALGILPAGTGNDVARGLGLPFDDPDAAMDRIVASLGGAEPRTRPVDAVRTSTGRWFAGMLSAGFDAAVNERANGMRRPRGRSRYVLAVLLELARLTPHRYRITIDRDARQVDAVLVTVGNTTSIGGGMRLTPDAKVDDGLLDVLVATPLPRWQLVRLLPKVFTGDHVHDEHVSIERGRVVTIDVADRRAPAPVVYADGERMGGLPVTLEVVPAALRVLV
jgi:diacylglycerol kinase (ATP)